MTTNKFLNKINIFSDLDNEEINNISRYMKSVDIKKDNILFYEGDEGSELFIVEKGLVSSSIKTPDNQQKEIARFTPGNFFGEMAIFENAPRSATCKTLEASRLYKMHEEDFRNIIDVYPSTAIKIMYKMLNITSQRLRNTGEFLSDMVRWGNEASKRAITDEFTGVYNRRFLDNALKDYFQSSINLGKHLSIAMMDLDRFREINELYGHETGNRLILEVVSVFKSMFREKDAIARYGGDEFTVILPETDLDEAGKIAERICQRIAQIEMLNEMRGPVTKISLSVGISSFPENTEDLKILKELADKALYKAKDEGRARVVLSGR